MKPKYLQKLNKNIDNAYKIMNIDYLEKPTIVIVKTNEINDAIGKYNPIDNIIYISDDVLFLKDETYIFASDIIGGLTNNKCVDNSYHEVKYWNNTMLCAETFAHFYEATLISPKQKAVLKYIFPNTFALFENMF